MKRTLITLMALASCAMGDETLLSMNFTALEGSTNNNLPEGWNAGQWLGTDNLPYYSFGSNGAVVGQGWKQNYLTTTLDIASQGDYTITFTLYNGSEDTGNMFFLSSDTYSIVMGNSYTSNSEIYVGTLTEAVGSNFVSFQPNTGINPAVVYNSTGADISGDISYTLTMSGGNMAILVKKGDTQLLSKTLTGMKDVTFDKIGFITDGDSNNAGVKNLTITVPGSDSVPEPTTATLSLLALAGLAMRRRRK